MNYNAILWTVERSHITARAVQAAGRSKDRRCRGCCASVYSYRKKGPSSSTLTTRYDTELLTNMSRYPAGLSDLSQPYCDELDTRQVSARPVSTELQDYWDDGPIPVCVSSSHPSLSFLRSSSLFLRLATAQIIQQPEPVFLDGKPP